MSEAYPTGESHAREENLDTAGYVEAFNHGQSVELPPDSPLRGRIMRGKDNSEFSRLALDDRRLVFIMGPDGLSELPGKPLRGALSHIGLTPDYVQGRIDQGFQFKLLVFGGDDEAPRATWDNTLDLVQQVYPDLADDVETHRQELKATPFSEFAARMPMDMDAIDLAGEGHPLFMSLERYIRLAPTERRHDPLALRRVLLHEVHLGPLFSGDGYTYTPDGAKGLAEYLVPNGPIDQLPDAQVISLPLS